MLLDTFSCKETGCPQIISLAKKRNEMKFNNIIEYNIICIYKKVTYLVYFGYIQNYSNNNSKVCASNFV